jgi:hypothetical protein
VIRAKPADSKTGKWPFLNDKNNDIGNFEGADPTGQLPRRVQGGYMTLSMLNVSIVVFIGDIMNNDGIECLEEFGFVRCGSWMLEDNKLNFKIQNYPVPSNVLYAFSTDRTIGYIGVSGSYLDNRIKVGYSRLVFEQIEKNLKNSNYVYILYYKPENKKYKGIELDMIRALEYPLQKMFKTQWTTKGYGGYTRLVEPFIEELLEGIQCKS